MTDSPETAPPVRPFATLKVDPQRATDGVWVRHPESADELRVRRLWGAAHLRAIEQAALDYEAKHGEKSAQTAEGQRHVEAVGLAVGVIVDWRIKADPERAYDAAAMTALLVEPGYDDLRAWVMLEASKRAHFRPTAIAGN
jgi:hypothetical protein